jgi:molybdopterin-guanine dinucleotide biosynthesis protein A
MVSWFLQAKVRVLTPAETIPFNPRGLAFFNVNTPAELSQAERWAGEEDDGYPKINAILPD